MAFPRSLVALPLVALACSLAPAAARAAAPALGQPVGVPPQVDPSAPVPEGMLYAPRGSIEGERKPTAKELLERNAPREDVAGAVLSPASRQALDDMAQAQRYDEVESYSRGVFRQSTQFTQWTLEKAQAGHVRLMWTLAERLALAHRGPEAAKWSYAALLGTEQESALCLDSETRFAAGKLADEHPEARLAIRQSPFALAEAKEFAFKALTGMKSYADPAWICRPYASEMRRKDARSLYVYEPAYYAYLRAQARNRLRSQWRMAGDPEGLPAFPAPSGSNAPIPAPSPRPAPSAPR